MWLWWFTAGGQLAIVSSAAGKAGVPFSGSYTGSKHAINVRISYAKIIQFNKFDIGFPRLRNLKCHIPITGIFQFSKIGKSWNRNKDYDIVSRSCFLWSFEKCEHRKSRRGILYDFYPKLIQHFHIIVIRHETKHLKTFRQWMIVWNLQIDGWQQRDVPIYLL